MNYPFWFQNLRRRYKKWRLGPRSANDHATHIPVLVALGLLTEVRSVLEFGSGTFSTLTFLNREAFPHLETILSFENDAAWYAKVREQVSHDPRITLTYADGPLHALVPDLDLAAYDLIFIDDATKASLRAETIQSVVAHCGPRNVIVVHDFEVGTYQRAADAASQKFRMTAFNPNTGVLWQGKRLTYFALSKVNRALRRNAALDLTDIHSWHRELMPIQR